MHPTFSLPKRLAYSFQAPARLLTASLLAGSLLGPALLAQPVLVKDVLPGPQGSAPAHLTHVNGTLFFTTADAATGDALWKSDGTAAGTVRVKDLAPGSARSFPAQLTGVNGTLFFVASDGTNGAALWKSDGTGTGTVKVRTIYPGSPAGEGFPDFELTGANGTLFFKGDNGTGGIELWKSDGTPAGTVMVKDIFPGAGSSFPGELTNANGTLFFRADDGTRGRVLWKSDGTRAGTVMVKEVFAGYEGSLPGYLASVNGTVFLAADDGISGPELWKSDGTAGGTVIVRDIIPGDGGSYPGDLTDVNGTLFFTTAFGLWKSDGTPAGTVMVRPVYATDLTNVDGTLFFITHNRDGDAELWKSDGTPAGTVQLVKDFHPGSPDLPPGNLTAINGKLFFKAYNAYGAELWQSDGTPAGTKMVKDINPGPGSAFAASTESYLTNVNGTLFFAADNRTNGPELWKQGPGETPARTAFRINAGGGAYQTKAGQHYQADAYFEGGVVSREAPGEVAGTGDDYLYQNGRHGASFRYNIPVGNGEYDVVLHFAETWWGNLVPGGAGSRQFNVSIEGVRKLTEYDVFAKTGKAMTKVQETFRVTVKDGVLNLYFSKGSVDLASVKAIEVRPVAAPAREAADAAAGEATLVRLYPNPAADQLTVRLPFPAGDVKKTSISDAAGRRLQVDGHRQAGNDQLQIDVSALQPGMYLLRLQSGRGEEVVRFVKK
jgi:ELWxxDGT repeat protein